MKVFFPFDTAPRDQPSENVQSPQVLQLPHDTRVSESLRRLLEK